MSIQYPHKWAIGWTVENGERVGCRAEPSGRLQQVCQRCGEADAAPLSDQYDDDCPGARIVRAIGPGVQAPDMVARLIHTLVSRITRTSDGYDHTLAIYLIKVGRSRDPIEQLLTELRAAAPDALEAILQEEAVQDQLRAITSAPEVTQVKFGTTTIRHSLFEVAPGVEVLPPLEDLRRAEERVRRYWQDRLSTATEAIMMGYVLAPNGSPAPEYPPLHLPVDPGAKQRDARQAQERMLEEMREAADRPRPQGEGR